MKTWNLIKVLYNLSEIINYGIIFNGGGYIKSKVKNVIKSIENFVDLLSRPSTRMRSKFFKLHKTVKYSFSGLGSFAVFGQWLEHASSTSTCYPELDLRAPKQESISGLCFGWNWSRIALLKAVQCTLCKRLLWIMNTYFTATSFNHSRFYNFTGT